MLDDKIVKTERKWPCMHSAGTAPQVSSDPVAPAERRTARIGCGIVFGLVALAVRCCCMCCNAAQRSELRGERRAAQRILDAIRANPELQKTVEDAAGVALPPPRPRAKLAAAGERRSGVAVKRRSGESSDVR